LKDNVKLWLNSLAAKSIHSWEELATKLLKRFFPAQRTRQLRREIQTFQQKDGALFFEAWEQFNDLLLKCPHHNLSQDDQVQAFYEGLNDSNKSLVDSACGGMLIEKNSEEAIELFETLSENSRQFSFRVRQGLKGNGVYEMNINGGGQTQMATMERKLDMLVKAMTTHNISLIQQIAQVEVCVICSHSDHTTETCPMSSFTDQQQANYVSQITILQKTILTQTLTMQGGEITPIFHGVIIRMHRIHNSNQEIFSSEITIKLHHKRSNQIWSQRRMTSNVLYSNF
jgi:hypothetical protein